MLGRSRPVGSGCTWQASPAPRQPVDTQMIGHGHLEPRVLAALQRSVGNQAATRLILSRQPAADMSRRSTTTVASSSPPTLQRQVVGTPIPLSAPLLTPATPNTWNPIVGETPLTFSRVGVAAAENAAAPLVEGAVSVGGTVLGEGAFMARAWPPGPVAPPVVQRDGGSDMTAPVEPFVLDGISIRTYSDAATAVTVWTLQLSEEADQLSQAGLVTSELPTVVASGRSNAQLWVSGGTEPFDRGNAEDLRAWHDRYVYALNSSRAEQATEAARRTRAAATQM